MTEAEYERSEMNRNERLEKQNQLIDKIYEKLTILLDSESTDPDAIESLSNALKALLSSIIDIRNTN